MGYLYLNFLDNLEKGSKSWDDFYTTSLTEQYEVLKRKLGGYASGTLQEFISMAFPAQTSKYYNISMPSFDRRMKENRFGKQCIYNIVIRPEKDSYLSYILPSIYDFIVIGDVTFGSVIDITVKGIELIDSKVAKFGEKKVLCTAACAFSKKEIPNRITGRTSQVADYGTRDMHDAVLTNDFVVSLSNDLYPVPHPERAIQTFSEWQKYINFRKYYLGKQSERCEEITDIAVCNSYMITKEAYRRNEDAFSAYLLDGIEQFSKGEQIILSKEVTGSDSFPLIRIEIAKNRKQILSDTYGRNGKGKPKYEANLQRYTRESMGVSSILPKYDEKGNMKGLKAYLLGERYLFTYVDVEPDLTALDKKYEKDYASACAEIDSKYRAEKHIRDYVFVDGINKDSSIERRFAEDLDNAEEVCVYAKLPKGFYIPTPVGNYSPDWAIAFNEGTVKHIYFVAETKGSLDSMQLRGVEKAKIDCARTLFNKMSTSSVRYEHVTDYRDLLNKMNSIN